MARKTSVVVDGVTLSRETIEKAVQELNMPEPEPTYQDFKAGELLLFNGQNSSLNRKGIVLDKHTRAILQKHYGFGKEDVWTVNPDNGAVYNTSLKFVTVERIKR